MNNEDKAKELWSIIDDIDTMADMSKGDHTMFYKSVMKIVGKRHKYFISKDGMTLQSPKEIT